MLQRNTEDSALRYRAAIRALKALETQREETKNLLASLDTQIQEARVKLMAEQTDLLKAVEIDTTVEAR